MLAGNALALALILSGATPREASRFGAAPQETPKPAATPQETAKPAASPRAARLATITSELDAATNAFRAAVAAAKTDAERQAIRGPDPSAYAPRVWEIVREEPRDATALEALAWLVEESRSQADRDQALAAIAKDHLESKDLAPLCAKLGENQQVGPELLELVTTSNPDRKVRGTALFALARHQLESAKTARKLRGPQDEGLEGFKRWLGADRAGTLARTDPATLEADAASTFDRVVREFGDVPWRTGTLGDRAEAELRELRELTVGKEAPEIAGEDLAGVAFRLSDYRGKVVLLDFWGNW